MTFDAESKMQFLYSLRSHGVTDGRVLSAMERIDRALFVTGLFAERLWEPGTEREIVSVGRLRDGAGGNESPSQEYIRNSRSVFPDARLRRTQNPANPVEPKIPRILDNSLTTRSLRQP